VHGHPGQRVGDERMRATFEPRAGNGGGVDPCSRCAAACRRRRWTNELTNCVIPDWLAPSAASARPQAQRTFAEHPVQYQCRAGAETVQVAQVSPRQIGSEVDHLGDGTGTVRDRIFHRQFISPR
jgi:hypothetical protein